MAAVLMTLVLSVLAGGVAWLVLGNRFEFDPDPEQNDLLNLGAYVGLGFFPILVLVVVWSP